MKHGSFSSGNIVLCSLSWPQTVYVAKAGLEFRILLPPLSKCWDSRRASHLAQTGFLIAQRASR